QERSLEFAQAWSDSLRELLVDQAEGGRAALEALTSTLTAPGRPRPSQEEANRALRQSLEAYREVIDRASATQERSTRLVQAALESFATTTQAQLELTRAFLVPLGGGGDQSEAFGSLVQGWNDAFLRPGGAPARGVGQPGRGLERRLPAAAGGHAGRPAATPATGLTSAGGQAGGHERRAGEGGGDHRRGHHPVAPHPRRGDA